MPACIRQANSHCQLGFRRVIGRDDADAAHLDEPGEAWRRGGEQALAAPGDHHLVVGDQPRRHGISRPVPRPGWSISLSARSDLPLPEGPRMRTPQPPITRQVP
jgi:hypothetical protein